MTSDQKSEIIFLRDHLMYFRLFFPINLYCNWIFGQVMLTTNNLLIIIEVFYFLQANQNWYESFFSHIYFHVCISCLESQTTLLMLLMAGYEIHFVGKHDRESMCVLEDAFGISQSICKSWWSCWRSSGNWIWLLRHLSSHVG